MLSQVTCAPRSSLPADVLLFFLHYSEAVKHPLDKRHYPTLLISTHNFLYFVLLGAQRYANYLFLKEMLGEQ